MLIGIIKCDTIKDENLKKYGDHDTFFISLLRQVNPKLRFKVYDALLEIFPAQLNECAAYIITGSSLSIYEDTSWMQNLKKLILKLHSSSIPVAGICFGHQLIASALGGKVELSPKGWGIGVISYPIHLHKDWMSPSMKDFSLLYSHQDQVIEPPMGAEVLAGGDFCPYAMLQIDKIITMQGHPEFERNFLKDVILSRKDRIKPETLKTGIDSLSLKTDHQIIASWIVNFLSTESSSMVGI